MSDGVIVFSPHPDDETLGCGGVIAKKVKEGCDVKVVILTDGRYAFRDVLGIDSNPAPEELKEMRKEEVKNALRTLGVKDGSIIFLDFVDGSLKSCQKDFGEKITSILAKYKPREIFIPHKSDGHVDHRIANKIIKKSIKKLGLRIECYQYMIKHRFARIGPIIESLINFLSRRSTVKIDISNFLHLKEQAIKEFKSEVSVPRSHKRPVVSDMGEFLKEYEIFIVERV